MWKSALIFLHFHLFKSCSKPLSLVIFSAKSKTTHHWNMIKWIQKSTEQMGSALRVSHLLGIYCFFSHYTESSLIWLYISTKHDMSWLSLERFLFWWKQKPFQQEEGNIIKFFLQFIYIWKHLVMTLWSLCVCVQLKCKKHGKADACVWKSVCMVRLRSEEVQIHSLNRDDYNIIICYWPFGN